MTQAITIRSTAFLLLFGFCAATLRGESRSALFETHLADPVEWRSWSPALQERAASEKRPLFFFVAHFGNSLAKAMLNETFSNQTIAQTVNESFLPVLVDINEDAELAATLTRMAQEHFQTTDLPVCLWTDAHLAPIAGGGYFPPTDDWGSQGYLSVARKLAEDWAGNREELSARAADRLRASRETARFESDRIKLAKSLQAAISLNPDAPNLPASELLALAQSLPFLAGDTAEELQAAANAALHEILANAGFDSISGGFFIGSNDPGWRLPLFQKATSDQALMLHALALLNERASRAEYVHALRLTADFVRNDLIKPNGLARQYLDSLMVGEGAEDLEGRRYLFGPDAVEAFSEEAKKLWNLNTEGNLGPEIDILGIYDGLNMPYPESLDTLAPEHDEERTELQTARQRKAEPRADNTAYTATNAALVRGLAAAGRTTGSDELLHEAETLFQSIRKCCGPDDGVLYNSDQRERRANSLDYALFIAAALDLHDLTRKELYLDAAREAIGIWEADPRFAKDNLILLSSAADGPPVADYQDLALPSAASLHIENLRRLGEQGLAGTSGRIEQILQSAPASTNQFSDSYLSLHLAAVKAQPKE